MKNLNIHQKINARSSIIFVNWICRNDKNDNIKNELNKTPLIFYPSIDPRSGCPRANTSIGIRNIDLCK